MLDVNFISRRGYRSNDRIRIVRAYHLQDVPPKAWHTQQFLFRSIFPNFVTLREDILFSFLRPAVKRIRCWNEKYLEKFWRIQFLIRSRRLIFKRFSSSSFEMLLK